jgi:hypothetical protein
MSLFGKILGKLGIGKKDKKEAAAATMAKKDAKPTATSKWPEPTKKQVTAKRPVPAKRPLGAKSARPTDVPKSTDVKPMEMVDVMSKLETMAKGTNLDWKVSIVDLLKVLDIDSSLAARKELAEELGCPPELMGGDSAKMNVWLHKTVLAKIAENGGNIPKELLD